jgi:NAD(P)-dependent dehydrogenase (short-subunit alcohol dehydrogenase family)
MAAKRVLITGCSTGIGRATAVELTKRGYEVVATARRPETIEDLDVTATLALDVDSDASVASVVADAGAIDVLVNNAGFGVEGDIETVPLDEVRRMFETNLFGAVAVIQAALPAMREAGGGSLVFVSSIGARISNPLLGMYHASKWGMSAMAEALAIECRPFGIRVVTLEPGMVDTDFPRATRPTGRAPQGEGPYGPLLTGLRAGFAAWRQDYPTTAEDVAVAVVAAAEAGDGPFRVPVGDDSVHLASMREGAPDDLEWQRRLRGFLKLEAWDRTG